MAFTYCPEPGGANISTLSTEARVHLCGLLHPHFTDETEAQGNQGLLKNKQLAEVGHRTGIRGQNPHSFGAHKMEASTMIESFYFLL